MNIIEKETIIMKKMGHPYIIKLIEIIDKHIHYFVTAAAPFE